MTLIGLLLLGIVVALVTPSGATTPTPAPSRATPSPAAPKLTGSNAAWARQICKDVPHDELLRTLNGYRPDRSGDIQFFANPPDFVGSGLPHVGPWDYVERVPMFWYGPGYIKPGVTVKRPVSLADIAPTQAALLKFPFNPAGGRVMNEALEPAASRQTPPKLIVTLIWDAAGMNVLNEWKKSWPNLKDLMSEGTSYSHGTVGTAPTSTAQSHATIGTGEFPSHHALVAHHFRVGNTMTTPWDLGSRLLDAPTLADLFDLNNGNKPIIAAVGSVAIHLGMMSHGATWGGGDRDYAVLTNVNNPKTLGAEGPGWYLPDNLRTDYQFPEFALNVPGYPQAKDALDKADGAADGKWRDQDIEEAKGGFDTPARIPWETELIDMMLKRLPLGRDATPDMMYINYKMIDYVSHVQSMNSPYMEDTVKVQDDNLPVLIDALDNSVGAGNYVVVLTADHGAMPNPKVTGAFVASPGKIGSEINKEFGDGTIQLTQNTTAFLDMPLLESRGDTVEDVAKLVQDLTLGQTYLLDAGNHYEPSAAQADDKLFVAAFPSYFLPSLPCVANAPLD